MKMKKEDLIIVLKKAVNRLEKGLSEDEVREIGYIKSLVDMIAYTIKFDGEI